MQFGTPFSIAIIGTGPRGISVIERLGARLLRRRPNESLILYAIDAVEVGCGRIWRTDQPRWFVMNNHCGEITMFSGPADGNAWRPGNGPTFAEWWRHVDVTFPGPDAYAPRAIYGRYLKFVLDTVEINLPRNVKLVRLKSRVTGLERLEEKFKLFLESGGQIVADRAIVCIGHSVPELHEDQKSLERFAEGRSRPVYVRADSAADMRLEQISRSDSVGVIGLGLSFYDVLVALTIGRGGKFKGDQNGLRYIRSGCEPKKIIAGSRSALPIPVRGASQRPHNFGYLPRFFTSERVLKLRKRAPLDFRKDLLPWILGEVNFVYIQKCLNQALAKQFVQSLERQEAKADNLMTLLKTKASDFGLHDFTAIDFESLAHPFRNRTFTDQAEFREVLIDVVKSDLYHSELGDFYGPRKAALEVLKDTRAIMRLAVDFGGLLPESHQDFIENIAPMLSQLSTGPSRIRGMQLLALLSDGLLDVFGPNVRFEVDSLGSKYIGYSPAVNDYKVELDALVDARVPTPNLNLDANPLVVSLLKSNIWRSYVNFGANPLVTGGVDVTEAPFNPVNSSGVSEPRMYVLGMPTEHTRWFMQVGIGRPGPWGHFFQDANAIAEAALTDIYAGESNMNALGDQLVQQSELEYCLC
jgi:hypothetical protein